MHFSNVLDHIRIRRRSSVGVGVVNQKLYAVSPIIVLIEAL